MPTRQLYCQLTADRQRIAVKQRRDIRWVSWDDNFVQTVIEVTKPWRPQLRYLPALCLPIRLLDMAQLVLLGTGGGGMLHYLHRQCPGIQIDAIDNSSEMIAIAKRYFGINQPIHCSDALAYLAAKASESQDHLMIDIFTQDHTPGLIASEHFWAQCERTTRQCMSLNVVSRDQSQLARLNGMLRRRYNHQTVVVPVAGSINYIIHVCLDPGLYRRLLENTSSKVRYDLNLGPVLVN